jgi:hypothetical protein
MRLTQASLFCTALLLTGILVFGRIEAGQETPQPISVDDYWLLVEETRSLAHSLESTTPETAHAQLMRVADEWAAIVAVSLPDGQVIQVDHTTLVYQMRASPPELEAIQSRLETLLSARELWPAPRHDRDDLGPLSEILQQDAFQWAEAEPSRSGQILARILNWLFSVLPDTNLSIADGLLRTLLPIAGAIVLAVILFYAFRGLFLDFVAESTLGVGGEDEEEMLTVETALKRAQTLSSAGDYRTAVRYLYLSTLLMMEERGLFRYDRAKTNREYLRSVRERPELATTLQDVVDVFDRVWYGFQPLSQAEYAHYQARVEALRQQR